MKRQSPKPDLRLDWRNQTMPVIRPYVMADGTKREIVDPDYERQYRAHCIANAPTPDWRDDPTYHMNRRKPKR